MNGDTGPQVTWPAPANGRWIERAVEAPCGLLRHFADLLFTMGFIKNIPASLADVEASPYIRNVLDLKNLSECVPGAHSDAVQYAGTAALVLLGSALSPTTAIGINVAVESEIGADIDANYDVSKTFLCALLELMHLSADLELLFHRMLVTFDRDSCSVTLFNDDEEPVTWTQRYTISSQTSLTFEYDEWQQECILRRFGPALPDSPTDPSPETLSLAKTVKSTASPNPRSLIPVKTVKSTVSPNPRSLIPVKTVESTSTLSPVEPNPRSPAKTVKPHTNALSPIKTLKQRIKATKQPHPPRRGSRTLTVRPKDVLRFPYSAPVVELCNQMYDELRRVILPTRHHHYLPPWEAMQELAAVLESEGLPDPMSPFREAARRAYAIALQARCGVREKAKVFSKQLTSEVSTEINSL